MPRANRHMLPGYCYHLTHRCHNRDFLLKFAKDRDTYKGFVRDFVTNSGSPSILGYCITSNHVHFLVAGNSRDAIPDFMHHVQGRFATYYNRRKRRTGGFWEGRYHATAVETGRNVDCARGCRRHLCLNVISRGKNGL